MKYHIDCKITSTIMGWVKMAEMPYCGCYYIFRDCHIASHSLQMMCVSFKQRSQRYPGFFDTNRKDRKVFCAYLAQGHTFLINGISHCLQKNKCDNGLGKIAEMLYCGCY